MALAPGTAARAAHRRAFASPGDFLLDPSLERRIAWDERGRPIDFQRLNRLKLQQQQAQIRREQREQEAAAAAAAAQQRRSTTHLRRGNRSEAPLRSRHHSEHHQHHHQQYQHHQHHQLQHQQPAPAAAAQRATPSRIPRPRTAPRRAEDRDAARSLSPSPDDHDPDRHEACIAPPPSPPQPKLGVVPEYLKRRQDEWRRQEQLAALAAARAACPLGHRLITEQERLAAVAVLRREYEHALAILAPLDTGLLLSQPKLARKARLEHLLNELEAMMDRYDWPKVQKCAHCLLELTRKSVTIGVSARRRALLLRLPRSHLAPLWPSTQLFVIFFLLPYAYVQAQVFPFFAHLYQ
eukprot:m.69053 g.69053  ORF g.69053 m.69053 type:complete len:352 (-) comp7787_c0_seq1:27-1082(-)